MANRRKKKASYVASEVVKKPSLHQQYRRKEFIIETVADPENPKQQVKRLRRKCVYDEMLARGSISQEQRDAAEQYAIICEKSFGGSGDLYARANLLITSTRNHWEPSAAQSNAYDKLFKIWAVMGRYHRHILNMIVLGNMSTKEISQNLHLNLHYTMGQVLSTFILLEEAMKDL